MPLKKIPEPKPLFLERMKELLGGDFDSYIESLKSEPPKSIRVNTLKISPEELKKRLEEKGWKIKQPWPNYPEVMIIEGKFAFSKFSNINENIITNKIDNDENKSASKIYSLNKVSVKNMTKSVLNHPLASHSERILIDLEPGELGRALEHLLGYYYVQELASMLPVLVLEPKPNELILDLCSAPGSKTTQLSATMSNTGTITANEVSLGRIKILASNLERCGCSNVIITKKEGEAFCKKLKKAEFYFDKILVDAPCSSEGTLRTTPKSYLMWNIKTIKNLPRIQKNLISSALEILKPNGVLVYSTCTHAPEENEGVVNKILKEFDNVEIEEINLPLKHREGITSWENQTYNQRVKKCARIYPQDNNTEGFFIAKLRKK